MNTEKARGRVGEREIGRKRNARETSSFAPPISLSPTLPLAFLLLTLALPARANEPIKVGSKNFTEGEILGEVITTLARAKKIEVQHRSLLGGTQLVYQALKSGDIDAYADYTGTIALEILRDADPADEASLREQLAEQGVGMSGRLGFMNTYALGMPEALAEKLNIRTISDLARPELKNLKFGFSEEFMNRGDGWPGLKSRYNLPQKTQGADHSINYTGLLTGSLAVSDLYSTDAEIRLYNLRTLDDDLQYFPAYHCVILYRQDLAERSPRFLEVVKMLEGTIDSQEMIGMNAKVRGSKGRISAPIVAAVFVKDHFGLDVAVSQPQWQWDLLINTRDHLRLVGESLLLAVIVAVPLGIWARKWPRAGQAILSVVGVLQTLPSMAILVFMVPLMGIGPRPAIVALFLYSLLPIVRNTYQGLVGIAENLKESAEVLGLPPRARLWLVELPLASPSILAGIKTAAVINVGTATIGALIGAGGYGQPILTGVRLNDASLLLQGAIPAAVMAVLMQFAFDGLERFVVPRGLRLGK